MSDKSALPTNGLLLYHHHHAYYSQRVLLALFEKNVTFSERLIQIFDGEHHEQWFLDLNPYGQIPVLKDGNEIISGSDHIITYLEDNFSDGVYKRLIPPNLSREQLDIMEDFRFKIHSIAPNAVTDAVMLHSQYSTDYKYPFNAKILRKLLIETETKKTEALEKLMEKHPELEEILKERMATRIKAHEMVVDITALDAELNNISLLLASVEKQLQTHPKDHSFWLICEDFTVADVYLTVLLHRLSQIGLENHLWSTLPLVSDYFKRAQGLSSYKRINATALNDLIVTFKTNKLVFIVIAVILFVSIVIGLIFTFK